jgi:hypothetical protein
LKSANGLALRCRDPPPRSFVFFFFNGILRPEF